MPFSYKAVKRRQQTAIFFLFRFFTLFEGMQFLDAWDNGASAVNCEIVKGTVSRDFRPSFFSIKPSPLGP
jgi:hypothetical protein